MHSRSPYVWNRLIGRQVILCHLGASPVRIASSCQLRLEADHVNGRWIQSLHVNWGGRKDLMHVHIQRTAARHSDHKRMVVIGHIERWTMFSPRWDLIPACKLFGSEVDHGLDRPQQSNLAIYSTTNFSILFWELFVKNKKIIWCIDSHCFIQFITHCRLIGIDWIQWQTKKQK